MKRSPPSPKQPPERVAGRVALPIIDDPLGARSTLTTALSTPNPLALITDDMREVDHVIAQRLTTTVPLIAQISQYISRAAATQRGFIHDVVVQQGGCMNQFDHGSQDTLFL